MRDLFDGVLAFVAVAEEQSFRSAAKRLGLTPAAVSKAIARLEEDVGGPLLKRTTRRVSLSPAGALFLPRCQEAVGHVQAGRDAVTLAQSAARGDLRVTLPFVLADFVVARLPTFATRYPSIRVRLRLSDRFADLVDAGIDVAIRVGDLEDSSLVARRLMTSRWATVAAPSYLARRGVPRQTADLADHNCLVFRSTRGRPSAWVFRDTRSGRGTVAIKPSGNLEVDQGELLVRAAIEGLGICQVFHHMVTEALRDGRLVEILADHTVEGPPIHAVCLPSLRRDPRIRAFVDHLAQASV